MQRGNGTVRRLLAALLIGAISIGAAAAIAQTCPGAKPPPPDGWKGSPLHQAIRRNDTVAANRLIDAGSVNERDNYGNTPLVAALTPDELLEPAGAVSAHQSMRNIRTENQRRRAIVTALIAHGAAVGEPGADGNTPLMQVAAWGYSPAADRQIAETLLRLGADVNARNDFGATALMLAAHRGKLGLVTALLAQGADRSIKNCRGESALTLAQQGGHHAVVALLSH
jgi:ankyrin repeat protein